MNIPTTEIQWLSHKQRNDIADAYKEKFHSLEEQTRMVEEHPFLPSFNFVKGSDLLSCNSLPLYREVRHKLKSYKDINEAERYFVSHRWLDKNHPDPDGKHLQMLKSQAKKDAYYWIDFSCLPQEPRTKEESALFSESISRLPSLMFNMNLIVLRCQNDGYLERAWCFVELLSGNILGQQIGYITDETMMATTINNSERDMLEYALLEEKLPSQLSVTNSSDLEVLRDTTKTVATFFKLRLVEHYMTLGQLLSNQKLFFGEDPYYFVAVCDFSKVMVWVFNKAKELGMELVNLTQDSFDHNFFVKMAEKENFRHAINPYSLPKKVTLDESRLGWLIINKHTSDSAYNLFYIITSMIK